MTEFKTFFKMTVEDDWLTVPCIALGEVFAGLGMPDAYCLVERDEKPFFRIDLYVRAECAVFSEIVIWESQLVLGFGERVHFIDLGTLNNYSYVLDGYFGHLYQKGDAILVASAMSLYCFNKNAQQIWYTPHLGIDGVIVKTVEKGVIHGEGEWDPPSVEWAPFQLSLLTGEKVDGK